MEKNNGSEIINPSTYNDWVAFAHACCVGCVYEKGSFENEYKRVNECLNCINEIIIDHYRHKKEQPVIIIKDKEGKNILEPLTLK